MPLTTHQICKDQRNARMHDRIDQNALVLTVRLFEFLKSGTWRGDQQGYGSILSSSQLFEG